MSKSNQKHRLRSRCHGRPMHLECLEPRQVLSGGTFDPPPLDLTPTNPVQVVNVVVLNFEPTVPSQQNQTLWEIFNWNDPRDLAAGYIADVESASGGAIDYEIAEWRDLNEFPIFTDGSRYTADQYVQNRINNSGWSSATADFYAIAEQQHLAELINAYDVDEIWMFGDHYFNLLGEAWMAGPQSFFVNGPSFPDFPVDRAVTGFGFSYERGVAEMLHNLGHRTENHIRRTYGGWNITNPSTPWDYFTANVAQSNTTSYGVGSIHFPFNANADYDYVNQRTFDSYADEFVADFPNQSYTAVPTTRDAWGDEGIGDWHRGYMDWFFGHLPRQDGNAPDGRANNWYKYIYDFNAYRPGTGSARDNEANLGAAPLTETGEAFYSFTLRYYDTQGIDTSSLDGSDLLVTGPNGFSQWATLVDTGQQRATTAGTARTVTYRITAPGGTWNPADSGSYTVVLQPNQVQDVSGAMLPSASLGTLRVDIPNEGRLDVTSMLASGTATVTASTWDIGGPPAIFDNNTTSLYRSQSINPAVVTLTFNDPQWVTGFRVLTSHVSANPAYRWKVESADSLADLDSATGSYQELVPPTDTPSDIFSTFLLDSGVTATHFRLTVERLAGDNYVHLNAWDLLTDPVTDVALPTATVASTMATREDFTQSFIVQYADDIAIDIATINQGDIVVHGPNGFTQTAAFHGLDLNVNGPKRDATYFFTAPGGSWGFDDSGLYTIELIEGQVRDTSRHAAVGGIVGSLVIDIPDVERIPPADMTELSAASWIAWADGATASTSDDTLRKVLGATSVRFDTTGGFDTAVRYAPPDGVQWDLSKADDFHFSVYAENTNQYGFQASPIVRFIDVDGQSLDFRYFEGDNPRVLWNHAIGRWLNVAIPIKSSGEPTTGWRTDGNLAFDWNRVQSVEIHGDTWGTGFALWVDAAGFQFPVHIQSSSFVSTSTGHAVSLFFDVPGIAASPTVKPTITHVDTDDVISDGDITVIDQSPGPSGLSRFQITFPGLAGGLLPGGNYRLAVSADAFVDATANPLSTSYVATFSTTPGDFNGNGLVEQGDVNLVRSNWGKSGSRAPNGWINDFPDAMIDQNELDRILLNWGNTGIVPASAAVLASTTPIGTTQPSLQAWWNSTRNSQPGPQRPIAHDLVMHAWSMEDGLPLQSGALFARVAETRPAHSPSAGRTPLGPRREDPRADRQQDRLLDLSLARYLAADW